MPDSAWWLRSPDVPPAGSWAVGPQLHTKGRCRRAPDPSAVCGCPPVTPTHGRWQPSSPGAHRGELGAFPLMPLGQGHGVTILMSHLGALVPAPARAAAPSFLTQRAEPPQAPHLLWPMARAARSPWGSRWLTNTFPLVFSTGEGCSVLTSAVPKGAVPSDVGHWKNFISPAGVGGRSVFYSGGALGAGTGAGVRGAAQGLQGLASGP